MNTQIIGVCSLIWSCLKIVIQNDLVNRAIDNWTNGTSNKIDDMVWKLLEQAAGVKEHEAKAELLTTGLAEIQAKYSEESEKGNLVAMRTPVVAWHVADVRTSIASISESTG